MRASDDSCSDSRADITQAVTARRRCLTLRRPSSVNQAREKLEKWADDMVLSAEKALADTKEQIKALRRQARQVVTLEEQHEIRQQLQKLERQQRRWLQEIFKGEDVIMEKRDSLVESLERRLAQRTETVRLLMIRWAVA